MLRGHLQNHRDVFAPKQTFFTSSGSLIEKIEKLQLRNRDILDFVYHWFVDAGLPFSMV